MGPSGPAGIEALWSTKFMDEAFFSLLHRACSLRGCECVPGNWLLIPRFMTGLERQVQTDQLCGLQPDDEVLIVAGNELKPCFAFRLGVLEGQGSSMLRASAVGA